jgi:KUP system potassium uptake protein
VPEALYSDLGHCGRGNIRASWIFVKTCLILNYLGQGAWLLANYKGVQIAGPMADSFNSFFGMMPHWFRPVGIVIATACGDYCKPGTDLRVIHIDWRGSTAKLWPKMKINFPTEEKGQLFIPGINTLLFIGCIGIVLYFQRSINMEAAYGLAITDVHDKHVDPFCKLYDKPQGTALLDLLIPCCLYNDRRFFPYR